MDTIQCGVYIIQSPCRGFYIGSTTNFRKRTGEHVSLLRGGRHHSAALQAASDTHGIDALKFVLIFPCSGEELLDLEQAAIECLDPPFNRSKNSRESLSTLWKDANFRHANSERATAQNKAHWQDPVYREKHRDRVKAMLTPEAMQKSAIGRARFREEQPEEAQRIDSAASERFVRMHADPEFAERHARRMAGVMRERRQDPEFNRRFKDAVTKSNSRPVQCVETGQVFESIKLAAEWAGIAPKSAGNIGSVCHGRIKSCGGYHWKFPDGEN
ncbi:GIY-YIG nuclease family protein [Paraburkholderia sp. SARCC-3016]|uniref:GIY-YIG nuclease family protein n=1 Tax=Paraburkholderia sp. SARCC-3016 TaxID=3058611 RepID=UPI002808A820|nr:GIY-YIG nuclease family protein [Paraburkholderia sp. SARCC-3016]MDQ7977150.1 GIY-YIG nuclease family protein [Paraburkholderia sp. SARCC-3016]